VGGPVQRVVNGPTRNRRGHQAAPGSVSRSIRDRLGRGRYIIRGPRRYSALPGRSTVTAGWVGGRGGWDRGHRRAARRRAL